MMLLDEHHHKVEWTADRLSRFWDYQSRFPEQYFTRRCGPQIVERLWPYLDCRRNVLDFGCGAGHLIAPLLERGAAVTGTDTSAVTLAAVNDRYRGYAGFGGAHTLDALLASEERFDALLAVEVLEHLDDEHLRSALGAMRRLLAAGGRLVVTTPNDEDLGEGMVHCPECGCVFHRWQHVRRWDAQSLGHALVEHGFAAVETLTTNLALTPRSHPLAYWRARLGQRLLGRKQPHLVGLATRPT